MAAPAPPRRLAALVAAGVLLGPAFALADGPADNKADNVRPIPPKGVAIDPKVLDELRAGLTQLRAELDALPAALKGKPALLELVPDAEVYHKAVRYAVEYGEFFKVTEADAARTLLKQGTQRVRELKVGKPSWPTATGLVVRGYRSKIDGSVQPYGLVVPASYTPPTPHMFRLDFWWHGRGETLSEVNFITDRQRSPGEFTPANAFVLHPYGRYCNANKFAGEVDTLECLEHVKKHYPIDDNRIVARGFSMGGAACWQFATHFPTVWCAAAPGAGFAETPEFLNNFQGEAVKPTWWEERLWKWYNATDYAQNIYNVPTVAYSGEIDKQKQAADVMAREMRKLTPPLELTHIIGPKTAHKYEPEAKKEVNRRIDATAAKGREEMPREVRFTTHTLRYNNCGWLEITGLERHWRPATVRGTYADGRFHVTAKGVTRLSVGMWVGDFKLLGRMQLFVNGKEVASSKWDDEEHGCGKAWLNFHLDSPDGSLAKTSHLQGPIDDAFMDRFLMVRPTGTPLNATVGAWAAGEMKHAVTEWRRQFRGDAPVKDDTAVTDEDIAAGNLVLWGDPGSNKVLARIADKLPVKWTAAGVTVGDKTYPAGTHVPLLIYPNPLNPAKYIVLNSGFTFREYDYLNNARQVPKLPDYAVVDVSTPPNSRWPGKVVRAGFFGEKWELLPDDGK